MSVYCDKYVGYALDIQEDWDKLSEDTKDKWLDNDNEALNYKGYYSSKKDINSTIMIIPDGMNGDYVKLMCVIKCETNTYEEDCDELVDVINEMLSSGEVPFSVQKHMREVYKAVFKKDLNRASDIKPYYLVHWH